MNFIERYLGLSPGKGVCDCVRLSHWFVPPSWQWRNSCGPRPSRARSAAFFLASDRDRHPKITWFLAW